MESLGPFFIHVFRNVKPYKFMGPNVVNRQVILSLIIFGNFSSHIKRVPKPHVPPKLTCENHSYWDRLQCAES